VSVKWVLARSPSAAVVVVCHDSMFLQLLESPSKSGRFRDASVVPGDLLIVPLGPWLTLEDGQALPGYRGLIAEDG
jgi:hypothetical protein